MTRRALVLSLIVATTGWSQFSPDREVERCRQSYDLGRFAEALQKAQDAIGLSNFTAQQRLTLHQIAGLSAFNLNDQKAAKTHFLQMLQLEPDYQLDPFAVAPVVMKLFEQVRKDNAESLNLVRQSLALKLEQQRLEQEERERLRQAEEERKKRLDELTRTVTIRTIEKRSLLVNFLPFGAGQFQQGRVEWGVLLAISEAIVAITSVIAYFAINSLYADYSLMLEDRFTADKTGIYYVTGRRIPEARMGEYRVWTALKYGTGAAFYALWAAGAGEALWHHKGEVITETKQPILEPLKTSLELFLTPGGLGAGLTVVF